MPWQLITETDIRDRLSGPELAAYKTAALATGQTDPLPGLIAQTVDEARGYIAAAGNVSLGEGTTVPSKLVSAVVAIVRWRLITRLPLNSAALLETRKQEYQDALRLLEQVAAGKFLVEEPTIAAAEQISVASPRFSGRTRQFTRSTQDGA
jgi:phage gp36-like protein